MVLVTGTAAMTPAFLGANPAQVPSGPQKGARALPAEEDLARALVSSLSETQRSRTIIAAQSLGDIVSGPGRAESLTKPAGLALADMTGDQRGQVLRLVEEYARNMRAELAEHSRGSTADVETVFRFEQVQQFGQRNLHGLLIVAADLPPAALPARRRQARTPVATART